MSRFYEFRPAFLRLGDRVPTSFALGSGGGNPDRTPQHGGLATRLTLLTAEQLCQFEYGEAFGRLLEGFVAAELLKQRAWTTEEFRLFHYRDRDGLEVDLVAERLGDRMVAGIVLHTGPAAVRFGDRLHALPVAAIWS